MEKEVSTRATLEQVWAAWTEPDKIAGWFVDRAEGSVAPGNRVKWCFDQLGYEFEMDVVEADPFKRLVLRAQLPGTPPRLTEVALEASDGQTTVRLRNSGFERAAGPEFEGVDRGWTIALALLRHYVERHFGQPRGSIFVLQPATFEYPDLVPWFTDGAALARWWTRTGSIGEEGESYHLELMHGGFMTGAVLARTVPEVLVSWTEIDGALTFKAFEGGGRRMIGLHATAWNLGQETGHRLGTYLNGAIARLAAALAA